MLPLVAALALSQLPPGFESRQNGRRLSQIHQGTIDCRAPLLCVARDSTLSIYQGAASDLSCVGCVSDGEIVGVSGSKVTGAVATATALASNPADCTAGQYAKSIDAQGNLTCEAPAGGSTPDVTCAVDEALTWNGSAWGCVSKVRAAYMADAGITAQTADYATTATTAGALSSDPSDCAANQYATGIAANGNLSCGQVAVSGLNATGTPSASTYLRGDGTWSTPSGGGGSPGGSALAIQYNDGASGFAGATYASIGPAGTLRLEEVPSTPSAPTTGAQLYAVKKAGRVVPNFQGPSGLDTPIQPAFFSNSIIMWSPGSGTAGTYIGNTPTVTATGSNPAIATTSLWASIKRLRWATTTTAGNGSGMRSNADVVWRGNAAGLGGWFFAARCTSNLRTTNGRVFLGLKDATVVHANVQPSTNLDSAYFGFDGAQATWRFCSNDNTGSATCTDLGANFPNNLATDGFEFRMFAKPNSSEIFYYAERLGTGATASGSVTTDLPRNTVQLALEAWVGNGTDAAANNLECNRIYLESDL